VLQKLASHNADIQRLIDRGYALSTDNNYLIVRDVPYLDDHKQLQWGAFVTKLVFTDQDHVKLEDHQVFFGGCPTLCGFQRVGILNLDFDIPTQSRSLPVNRHWFVPVDIIADDCRSCRTLSSHLLRLITR